MGVQRVQYQIVGRQMSGKEVTGYYLQSMENNKNGLYTREQTIYLVGRGQVTNCSGQIYKDKVLLRGEGINLEDLPIVNAETDQLRSTESIGHVKKNITASQAVNMYNIVASIVDGRNTLGYVIQNLGGQRANIDRNKLLLDAREGRVANARVQLYKGQYILKGINCDLTALPKISPQDAIIK